MNNESKWIVRGYEFTTEEETRTACLEYSKIKQIEKKIDYKKPGMIYQLYNKAVDGKIFKTVIGYEYLRKLQKYLLDKSGEDVTIKPIPVFTTNAEVKQEEQPKWQTEEHKLQIKKEQKKSQLLQYCVIVLAALVIAMFAIMFTGNRPTILNYERALQNKYAQWEEELQQRENVIKEKERELRIASE